MLPLTKKDIISFTPSSYENKSKAPVYLIGIPTLAGRANYRRKLKEEGLSYLTDEALLAVLRDGVTIAVEDHQQPEILAIIDEFESAEEKPEELVKKIQDIETQIQPIYPPYAKAVADREYYLSLMPIIAAQCFLQGIENGVKYEARNGLVTESCLESIPENDLIAIGWKAVSVLSPSKEQEKNSASPLLSPSEAAISAAGK